MHKISVATKANRTPSPHVFSIGAAAFHQMINDNLDQSVLISGESGAVSGSLSFDVYFAYVIRSLHSGQNGNNEKSINLFLNYGWKHCESSWGVCGESNPRLKPTAGRVR